MSELRKIEFVRDYVVMDGHQGTTQEQAYKAGATPELPLASCEHFINRGVARWYSEPETKSTAARKGK